MKKFFSILFIILLLAIQPAQSTIPLHADQVTHGFYQNNNKINRSGSSWTPASLAGNLIAWYKANDEAYSDGNAVTTFTDKSGNSRNLTPTLTTEPEFKVNIINGKSVYRFHSSLDSAKSGSDWLDKSTAKTYYFVVKIDGVQTGALFGSSDNDVLGLWLGSVTVFRSWTAGSGDFEDLTLDDSSAAFQLITIVDNATTGAAGTWQVYQNNTLKDTSASRTPNDPDSFWLGCTGNSAAQGLDGDIAEAWVQEGAASSAERTSAYAYVTAQYGV